MPLDQQETQKSSPCELDHLSGHGIPGEPPGKEWH
jgi:hypothetical protein